MSSWCSTTTTSSSRRTCTNRSPSCSTTLHRSSTSCWRVGPTLPCRWRACGPEAICSRSAPPTFDSPTTRPRRYLNETMGLHLAAGDVDVLDARTEGWIAALQLAALSLQGRDDVGGFIENFAGDDRFVVDYLVEEVLERQPDDVRDFLLADLGARSAHRIALRRRHRRQPAGRATLELLDRANLFLVALDDRRHWYRYHHLFADVLRARLLDERPGSDRRAAPAGEHWYARERRPGRGDRARDGRSPLRPCRTADRVGDADAASDPPGGDPAALARGAARRGLRRPARAQPSPWSGRGWRPVTPPASSRCSTRRAVAATPSSSAASTPRRSCSTTTCSPGSPRRSRCTAPAGAARRRHRRHDRARHTRAGTRRRHRTISAAAAPPRCWGSRTGRSATSTSARRRYADAVGEPRCRPDFIPDVLGCSLALADIQIAQGRLRDARRTFDAGARLRRARVGAAGHRRHARRA